MMNESVKVKNLSLLPQNLMAFLPETKTNHHSLENSHKVMIVECHSGFNYEIKLLSRFLACKKRVSQIIDSLFLRSIGPLRGRCNNDFFKYIYLSSVIFAADVKALDGLLLNAFNQSLFPNRHLPLRRSIRWEIVSDPAIALAAHCPSASGSLRSAFV
jgi:hypothetical protein